MLRRRRVGGGGAGLPIRIVAAIDLAEDCCLTYRYNHPNAEVVRGDVTAAVDWRRLKGRVDLVLGGIPCEEISVARNNRQLSETELRGWHKLLDGVLEGIEYLQPPWWCVENVIGMRKHLAPLTPYAVLDASGWSAQKRKRMFMGRFPMPARPAGGARTLSEVLQPGPFYIHMTALRAGTYSGRQWYSADVKRVLQPDRPAPTVTDCGTRHVRGFILRLPDGRERVLQLTEAARLQGFPEDYVFVAAFSRAWKMVAQAIQIDLGRAILRGIVEEARSAGRLAA